jgi:hypothetical protein
MDATGCREGLSMTSLEAVDAFEAFCAQRNPRLRRVIPQRTPYEQMLADLEQGDAAVKTAFTWAQSSQNASAEAVLAEWRRYAQNERAALRSGIELSHSLAAAPDGAALGQLDWRLGGASPELLELYRRHDGANLFVDAEQGGSGLYFYPIAEMAAERDIVSERLDQPPMEMVEDGQLQIFGRPAWLEHAVVFGGFGYVPERLLLCTEGEHRGSVFLFCHDPVQLVQLADSVASLMEQLGSQPAPLLRSYGGAGYQGAIEYEADGPAPAQGLSLNP